MNLSRLVRSELLKVRTTRAWWIFLLASLVCTGLTVGVRILQLRFQLKHAATIQEQAARMTPEQFERYKAAAALKLDPVRISSDLFTAGQFAGGVLAMLLGILLVTSEYQNQTATMTFLTTPKRVPVVLAKLVASLVTGLGLWLIASACDVVAGTTFLTARDMPTHLGEWPIVRSMLLSLMMHALWSLFGVGWGVLLRTQLGATISGVLGYVLGSQIALAVFKLVHELWIPEDWVLTAMVVVPTTAAEVAVSPTKTWLQSPPQWVGILVMLAYGLGLSGIGAAIIRRRDVT